MLEDNLEGKKHGEKGRGGKAATARLTWINFNAVIALSSVRVGE